MCDGRDEDGLYHINWGWGGSYNGYFDINILNPDYQGSFPAEDGYTRDACIVIGIAPDNGKVDKPLMEKPSSHVGQYDYNNLKWTRQKRNNASESFAGSVDIVFCNPTDKDFDGMAGLGIKDDDGNVKLIAKAVDLYLPKQKGNATYYRSHTFDFDYAFPKGCTILYGVYSHPSQERILYFRPWLVVGICRGQGSHRHTTAHCRRPIRQRHEREGIRLERQPGGWLRHSRELRQVAAGNIYRERQETVEEIIS